MTKQDSEIEFELNCDPSFTSGGWGRRVKRLGGRFTPCRGSTQWFNRHVVLPGTIEGKALAQLLQYQFPVGGRYQRLNSEQTLAENLSWTVTRYMEDARVTREQAISKVLELLGVTR